jgi:hypothetical protein
MEVTLNGLSFSLSIKFPLEKNQIFVFKMGGYIIKSFKGGLTIRYPIGRKMEPGTNFYEAPLLYGWELSDILGDQDRRMIPDSGLSSLIFVGNPW